MFFMADLSANCLTFPVNPSARATERPLAGISPLPNGPEIECVNFEELFLPNGTEVLMDVLQVIRDQRDRLGDGIHIVGNNCRLHSATGDSDVEGGYKSWQE